MHYTLELQGVAATIGYLTCTPTKETTDSEALNYLTVHPLDEYMHKYLLGKILNMSCEEISLWVQERKGNPVVETLIAEAALQRDELKTLGIIPPNPPQSPLVDLVQEKFPDMDLHRHWSKLFSANIIDHKILPEPEKCPAVPYAHEKISQASATFVTIKDILHNIPETNSTGKASSLKDVVARAKKALNAAGITMGRQMLHQQSLAPVGLVRDWELSLRVINGQLDYTLHGKQTSFGRGIHFEEAEVGLLMEICERVSSWANINQEGAVGYKRPLPMIRARYSELQEKAMAPNSLPLEVPNGDLSLHWVLGERPDGSKLLVPAQFVFLFSNLDEPLLCSGLGSTGLGAGLDTTRARLTALLEVIERDAESVMPYNPARCFRIKSDDDEQAALLEDFAKRGIELFFEDITPELGVPCYRAFVIGPEGQVTKGASAALSGPKACISAMLEVPYPYPWGPPSRPAPRDLPVRRVEELPDFSTGNLGGDLQVLETALVASKRSPVYVDLTREDMNIPVCRAIIPGMELMADFDRNSRLSARLFTNLEKDRKKLRKEIAK